MKKWIKILIWVYVILLLVEGALRKWVFPSMSDLLLVARDPVLLVIYALALIAGVFPRNAFIVGLAVLAVLSTLASLLGGHTHLIVLAYGLRINYLHLPLIWIMAEVMDRRDVERMGAFLLIMAIPTALIMIAQFRAPMDAFINRGVGTEEIGQIFGADGRIRPPGLFAFITGPQLFLPLCAAFFFAEIGGSRRLPWYWLVASGLAVALALPVSISRTAMLATGVVAIAFLCALPFSSARFTSLARPILLLALVGGALTQVPAFKEGISVFMIRWTTAGDTVDATAWDGIIDRTMSGFSSPYYFMTTAPALGYGIGTGSNVGARLMSGNVGFMLAEEEWGKILLELGPVLGAAFILYRFILMAWLGWLAWCALRRDRNALPILIFAATAQTIVQGQWAPPTVLGFAVVGAGLLLAAIGRPQEEETVTALTRRVRRSFPVSQLPSIASQPAPSDRRPPSVPRPLAK